MHTEYRILNVVLAMENNQPAVLADIAVFNVDNEKGINDFVGLWVQTSAKRPYVAELITKKNTEVVILDDIKFDGNLKTLIKKNKHLVMSQIDYQYKDYVYVICKVDDDSYLIYSTKNSQEIISFNTLHMYDNMGRLFNAVTQVKTVRKKEKHSVITGTNLSDEIKRSRELELRTINNLSDNINKSGKFALDMSKLKSVKEVKRIAINAGQLERLTVCSEAAEGESRFEFKLPNSVKNLLSTGRQYIFEGHYDVLDLSSVNILNKNSLLIKGKVGKLRISEDAVKSSNLDFLVYSLKMYTGNSDYKIDTLEIVNVTNRDSLDLAIKLLAELYFNTDYNSLEAIYFPIQHIKFSGEYINDIKNYYNTWIEKGLTSFSMILLANYIKAVNYYKKVLKRDGKAKNELSVQSLMLLSEYEEALMEECYFFNLAYWIFTGITSSEVYKTIGALIEQNQADRVSVNQSKASKDILIDTFLNNLN